MSTTQDKGAGSHSVSDSGSSSEGESENKNQNSGGVSSSSSARPNKDQQDKKSKEKGQPKEMPYATRHRILTQQEKNVEEAKARIQSMSISEKRKLYKCRNHYTTLDDIQTWPEHFVEELKDDSINKQWWKRNKNKVAADIKPDLNAKISVFRGDITSLEIDAIANAANESLLGGGGVDGAIHRAAGIDLFNECELLHGCAAGNAEITCGYKLPAKHVIHTVGPRGERSEVLQNCYQNSLNLVKKNNLTSVAFPCISTGIFGYPNENAAKVALQTVRDWLDTEDYAKHIERIIFCLFLEKDVDIYNEQLQLFFPVERD